MPSVKICNHIVIFHKNSKPLYSIKSSISQEILQSRMGDSQDLIIHNSHKYTINSHRVYVIVHTNVLSKGPFRGLNNVSLYQYTFFPEGCQLIFAAMHWRKCLFLRSQWVQHHGAMIICQSIWVPAFCSQIHRKRIKSMERLHTCIRVECFQIHKCVSRWHSILIFF